MMKKNQPIIWIFCSIIDNLGDIGISYRLARELTHYSEWEIYLMVDDMVPFKYIESKISTTDLIQKIPPINIVQWIDANIESCLSSQPDVIIETFGCFSEHPFKLKLQKQPLWINIEYLSAENWTLDFHLKPSILHTGTKFFYFLGFTEESGGLLIEKNYAKQAENFKKNPIEIKNFLKKYQIQKMPNQKIILLFSYESMLWNIWIQTWDKLKIDYQLWIAGKKTFHIFNAQSNHRIQLLPYVDQVDFDKLLWLSDIAIVRGEDSFVRAQLAGIPFFWHIYPQDNGIHLKKLTAFWQKVSEYFDPSLFFHHQRLSFESNQNTLLSQTERLESWKQLFSQQQTWLKNAQMWQNYLFSQTSAFEKLTQFIKKKLQ